MARTALITDSLIADSLNNLHIIWTVATFPPITVILVAFAIGPAFALLDLLCEVKSWRDAAVLAGKSAAFLVALFCVCAVWPAILGRISF